MGAATDLECGCFVEGGKIVEYCPDHKPTNRAYDLLQSEGHTDGPEPRDLHDEFDAGRD